MEEDWRRRMGLRGALEDITYYAKHSGEWGSGLWAGSCLSSSQSWETREASREVRIGPTMSVSWAL